jgi:hypothetical protein
MPDNLLPSGATESGSLNLPEPFGRHRSVMGLLYLYIPKKCLKKRPSVYTRLQNSNLHSNPRESLKYRSLDLKSRQVTINTEFI